MGMGLLRIFSSDRIFSKSLYYHAEIIGRWKCKVSSEIDIFKGYLSNTKISGLAHVNLMRFWPQNKLLLTLLMSKNLEFGNIRVLQKLTFSEGDFQT